MDILPICPGIFLSTPSQLSVDCRSVHLKQVSHTAIDQKVSMFPVDNEIGRQMWDDIMQEMSICLE